MTATVPEGLEGSTLRSSDAGSSAVAGPSSDARPAGGAVPDPVVVSTGELQVTPVVRRRNRDTSVVPGPQAAPDEGTGRSGGGRGRPSGRSGRSRRGVTWLQAGAAVVFVALLLGLVWFGYQASLRITGGTGPTVTDPTAPGYVAEVKPTPVDLVAVTGPDGKLASALIVSAGAEGKGGTLSAVPSVVVTQAGEGTDPQSLATSMEQGGIDALRQDLGDAVTFGFTGAETVSTDTVEQLAQLVGPITITNIDNLIAPSEELMERSEVRQNEVRYPAGPVTLQPEEIVPFLQFVGADESEVNQSLRHQAVWEALFTGLQGKDLSGVTAATADGGSSSDGGASGLLGLLPDLLAGTVNYEPVPLAQQPVPGTYFKVYTPDPTAMPAYVARTVPFPTAASPGQRARVRLLNGTKDEDAAVLVAPKVVAAGGEISLLGNADSFDESVTRVEYVVPEAQPAAEAIATALGVKATRAAESAGSVDVNVVVGRDRSS